MKVFVLLSQNGQTGSRQIFVFQVERCFLIAAVILWDINFAPMLLEKAIGMCRV